MHPTHSVWEGKTYDHPRQHLIAIKCDDIDATVDELRAKGAHFRGPIVFVTSLITPEEARDARRINGHRISAKPHTAAELLRVVEENLPCCSEA